MAVHMKVLIASSTDAFLRRFEAIFRQANINVWTVMDGFEALSLLELNKFDVLLVDGGDGGLNAGLSGIAGDELSHMWRQIEGRAAHLLIGYVSDAAARQPARSRPFKNPVDVVRNRGVDHHFWSDDEDDRIAAQLLGDLAERRASILNAIEGVPGDKITRMAAFPKNKLASGDLENKK